MVVLLRQGYHVFVSRLEFDLLGHPPSANKRLHHMARWRSNRDWKGWTHLALMDAVNRGKVTGLPWSRIHVRYVFHYPRVTHADLDNLLGSMKPCQDGMVGIVGDKDDSEHIHDLSASVEVVR